MSRHSFFYFFIGLSCVVGFLQTAAVRLSLYHSLPWLDVVMHILGGVWIASVAFVFFQAFLGSKHFSRVRFMGMTTVVGFIAAVLWEQLELLFGLNQIAGSLYWPDTLLDVVLGASGACLGAYVLTRSSRRS